MDKTNKKLVFEIPGEETTADIIYSILNNNSLSETEAESVDKSIKGIKSRFKILKEVAYKFAEDKNGVDASKALQTQLGIQEQTANKIISDINQKLIPYAKVIITSFENQESPPPPKADMSELLNSPDKITPDEAPIKKTPRPRKIVSESSENVAPPTPKNNAIEKKSSGSDSYREPIA